MFAKVDSPWEGLVVFGEGCWPTNSLASFVPEASCHMPLGNYKSQCAVHLGPQRKQDLRMHAAEWKEGKGLSNCHVQSLKKRQIGDEIGASGGLGGGGAASELVLFSTF